MLFAPLLSVENLLHLVDPRRRAEVHLRDDLGHQIARSVDAGFDEITVFALLCFAVGSEPGEDRLEREPPRE